jgi:hypothetical protein
MEETFASGVQQFAEETRLSESLPFFPCRMLILKVED